MRRRCSLCGGKLNGNICTECGLDNSKNDDQYVTLENSGHEESLTHVHTEEEKPYEGKTMTRENVRKAKNADKNAKKAAAKKASKNAAAGKANPVGNGYSAANASYNTVGAGYRQTGNQSIVGRGTWLDIGVARYCSPLCPAALCRIHLPLIGVDNIIIGG